MIDVNIESTKDGNLLMFKCPHCFDLVEVLECFINCTIFRHAVLKETMQQINPHASKIECDSLVEENKVYGCAKPFRILKENNKYIVVICDYI